MIPHILHFVWVGPLEMPSRFHDNIESWKQHHPKWDIKLWTDSNIHITKCATIYNQAKLWVRKADIARLDLLSQYGGVYMDCDVFCLRNIEPILENIDAFASYEDSFHVCNAALGCTPNHPWINEAIRMLNKQHKSKLREATGRAIFTKITPKYKEVKVFGCDTFFPRRKREDGTIKELSEFSADSYSIHEWSGYKN